VNALREQGHKVEILSPPGADPERQRNTARSIKWFHPLLTFVFTRKLPDLLFEIIQILYNVVAYLRIKHAYRPSRFDAIYERYSTFSFAGAIFAKRYNIPIILEVNNTTSFGTIRHLALKRFAGYVERKVLCAADSVITVSSEFKRLLVKSGVQAYRISVMHNAVDPKVFSYNISGLPIREKYNLSDKSVVGFVGSMVPWHGLQSLLKCAQDMSKEYGKVCFLLVGDFRNLSPELMKIADGLDDCIIFTDKVPHHEIPKYIAAMDVAIMPNSNSYGSPMKVFEYMAMGKPTIAPDLAPLREIITHGVNGLLIRPGDPEDMKSKIIKLMSNSELRNRLGRNAVNSIMSNHTWDINSRKIVHIFDTLLQTNRNDYQARKKQNLFVRSNF